MKYLFELNFNTATHFGSDIAGYGVEEVQGFAHADTIFSALMNTIIATRNTYNYKWLNDFLSEEKIEQILPFKVSSFGFVKYIEGQYKYFIPKPEFIPNELIPKKDYNNWKIFKNIKYITLERYLDILKKNSFDLDKIIEKEIDNFWLEYTRDQIQTDIVTAATNIYTTGEVFYEKFTKPFILVDLDEENLPLNDFINFLRLVGKFGLGGRRTSGCGIFSFTDEDWFSIEPNTKEEVKIINPGFNYEKNRGRIKLKEILSFNSSKKYLFSTLFPKESINDIYAYNLIIRRGWIFSTSSFRQLKRKTCYMIGEGSIFKKEIKGTLVDTTPDAFTDHIVWRYGIPFYLPYTDLE